MAKILLLLVLVCLSGCASVPRCRENIEKGFANQNIEMTNLPIKSWDMQWQYLIRDQEGNVWFAQCMNANDEVSNLNLLFKARKVSP